MPGTLEAEAQRRKERLALLKKRKQPEAEVSGSTATDNAQAVAAAVQASKINHRNYDPETQTLRRSTAITKATAEDKEEEESRRRDAEAEADTAPPQEEETVEFVSQAIALQAIEDAKNAATAPDNQLDLFNLQPKKPNWDLKRDLEQKLDRLKPRMDAAVAQLLRERIAASNNAEESEETADGNLAQAVTQMEEEQSRRELEV